jgi:predicted glycogen debranching enzyme
LKRIALQVDANQCADLDVARGLEWMVANGRGGYAMATVNQMHTRRYHGLLVAAIEPPVTRYVLLAKLDVTAVVDGLTYELATNDYPEAVHPQGYRLLESFRAEPYPTWRFRAGDCVIEQTLCIAAGEDTTFIRFRIVEGSGSAQLTVRPLCTSRHFHHLTHYQDMGPPTVEIGDQQIDLQWSQGRPGYRLSHNGTYKSRPDWYYQFVLSAEWGRGYDSTEDLFTPGLILKTLTASESTGLVIAATTQIEESPGRQAAWNAWPFAFENAAARAESAQRATGVDDPLAESLSRASSDFIVSRGTDQKTVIAGFPWFGDWGRDTFISLPGLCLVTGRFAEARGILQTFAKFVDRGMIPNRFPDYGEAPAYDTADATLWYIHAMDRYAAYTGDWALIEKELYPVVCDIVEAHEAGTRHGIRVCDDGLLAAGEHGYALTWMDAKLPGRAVTPRIGKPCEINALWFNALQIAAAFGERMGDAKRAARWRQLALKARTSFNTRFWCESAGCLFDVVDVDGQTGVNDGSIRPNQLLAISLTHAVLDSAKWRAVVGVCERDLLTPIGLRTLATNDPAYRGGYEGNQSSRDSAYHQGTVWPWLLGPFVSAYVKANGGSATARTAARRFLAGLETHLSAAGIGGVSEVADGNGTHQPGAADLQHRPDGCPWQAWSVAEPLRALCEDVLATHPANRTTTAKPTDRREIAPAI